MVDLVVTGLVDIYRMPNREGEGHVKTPVVLLNRIY